MVHGLFHFPGDDGTRRSTQGTERSYDVTNPAAPTFVQYKPNASLALAPEGVSFVSATDSPNGNPLVIVSNEVSGTVTIYQVRESQVAVTLSRFEAVSSPDGVDLVWETSEEWAHSHFDVLRRHDLNVAWATVNTAPVVGAGSYSFRDETAPDGYTIDYRIEAVERNGSRSTAGTIRVLVNRGPGALSLGPGRPNPFRARTAFALDLPESGPVRAAIFDASGRMVRTLSSQVLESGRHELTWDGRSDAGTDVPAGVYFVRVATDRDEKRLRIVRER